MNGARRADSGSGSRISRIGIGSDRVRERLPNEIDWLDYRLPNEIAMC